MSPEQMSDVLDCGNPQEAWQAMVRHWRQRAVQAREIVLKLRADAKDATESALEHEDAARDFDGLADALERASVTFPIAQPERPGPPVPSKPHGHSVIA
jgi:hypothetical protein